jgi:Dyggve-Melchior-Clausen syndrome protein
MGAAPSSDAPHPSHARTPPTTPLPALDVLCPGRPLARLLRAPAPGEPDSAPELADLAHGHPLPEDLDHDLWASLFRDYVIFDTVAQPCHRALLDVVCASAVRNPLGPAASDLALVVRAAICRVRDYVGGAGGPRPPPDSPTSSGDPDAPDLDNVRAKQQCVAFDIRQVLGALLLARGVLTSLCCWAPPDADLCLILGACGHADAHPAVADTDRIDIGQSVLWQLLTSALDCIIRRDDSDPIAPHVVLAAVILVQVSLSATYLAPAQKKPSRKKRQPGQTTAPPPGPSNAPLAPNSLSELPAEPVTPSASSTFATNSPKMPSSPAEHVLPLAASLSTPHQAPLVSSLLPDPPARQLPHPQLRTVPSAAPAPPTYHSLLAAIIDRYPRPGVIVASLLDLAVDATPFRDGISQSLSVTSSSFAASTQHPRQPPSVGSQTLSTASIVASQSAALASSVVASVSRQLSFALQHTPTSSSSSPSPVTGAAAAADVSSSSPSAAATSFNSPPTAATSALSALTARFHTVSHLRRPPSSDADVGGILSPQVSLPWPLRSSSEPSVTSLTRRVIARSPTLLAEQALSLLAVLCAPRESAAFVASSSLPPVTTSSAARTANGSASASAGTGGLVGDCDTGTEELDVDSAAPVHPPTPTLPPPPFPTSAVDAATLQNPYRVALLSFHDVPQRGPSDELAYSFSRLYEALGSWIDDQRGALVAYYLVVGNRRFRTYVLARTDPDVIVVPLVAAMHVRASVTLSPAPADIYIPAIISLILSSDPGFCAAIDEIMLPHSTLTWFDDRARLDSSGVSLSGIVMLVCIRCIQQSVITKRRAMESYLASICMSTIANISGSMTGINSLAADRLVALVEFVGKRQRKAAVIMTLEPEMPLLPPPVGKTLSDKAEDLAKERANTTIVYSAPDASLVMHVGQEESEVVFQMCGSEQTLAEYVATLSQLVGTGLEVVASVLRSRSNVSVNRHLMYSILHREAVFDVAHLESNASARTRAVVGRIRGVIDFLSRHIDSPHRPTGSSSFGIGGGGGASKTVTGSHQLMGSDAKSTKSDDAAGASSGVAFGISVDRVFDVIDRYARMLPRDALGSLPELRFEYCESNSPDGFFLPYAWVLAMRESPLSWDPAQFPDARIALASSVFHPPRPVPPGFSGMSTPQR